LTGRSAVRKLASMGRRSASNAFSAGNCDNENVVLVVSGCCAGCAVEILNDRAEGDELRKDQFGCVSV
jgi:hypothetical protein